MAYFILASKSFVNAIAYFIVARVSFVNASAYFIVAIAYFVIAGAVFINSTYPLAALIYLVPPGTIDW